MLFRSDGDLNKLLPGTAEYFTRADWTKGWHGTWGVTANDDMLKNLKNQVYSLTENGEGLVWGANNGLRLIDLVKFDDNGNYQGAVELDDPLWDTLLENVTLEEAVNFMEKAGDNFDPINSIGLHAVTAYDGPVGFVSDQVPSYSVNWTPSEKDEPTYVGSDNPYGSWQMPTMPTEPVVAATFNQELVEREGELLGEDGIWANVSGLQGPGVNLHTITYCGRWHEYYSEDAMLTNRMAKAITEGTWKKGTWTVMKHFAINDMESNRTGLSTFFTEQSARENGLRAFQSAVTANSKTGVMTAYNRIGTTFSGGHKGLVTQILRNEWGFDGWVMTDYAAAGFDYMNWLDNIYAGGGGCLCTTGNFSTSAHGSMSDTRVLSQVQADSAFQHEMQEALKHFLYVFAGSNAMNGVSSDTKIIFVRTWWENALTAANICLGVLTAASLAGLAVTYVKSKKNRA